MLRSTLVKRLLSRCSRETFMKIGDISFPHTWHFSLLERERLTKPFHLFSAGLVGRDAQQRWWGKRKESGSVLLQMLEFTSLTILAWMLQPEHRVGELLLKNGCSRVPIFTSNPPELFLNPTSLFTTHWQRLFHVKHLQHLHQRSASPLRWKKLRWWPTTCSAVSCAQSLTPLGKSTFLLRRVTSEWFWWGAFRPGTRMTAGEAEGSRPSGRVRYPIEEPSSVAPRVKEISF